MGGRGVRSKWEGVRSGWGGGEMATCVHPRVERIESLNYLDARLYANANKTLWGRIVNRVRARACNHKTDTRIHTCGHVQPKFAEDVEKVRLNHAKFVASCQTGRPPSRAERCTCLCDHHRHHHHHHLHHLCHHHHHLHHHHRYHDHHHHHNHLLHHPSKNGRVRVDAGRDRRAGDGRGEEGDGGQEGGGQADAAMEQDLRHPEGRNRMPCCILLR